LFRYWLEFMSFGIFALLIAASGAFWLLFRLASSETGGETSGEGRNMTILKGVVWLGLVAALAVAKLWPLAFMMLIAAGGVMAIEIWKDRTIEISEAGERRVLRRSAMTAGEAAEVLGVSEKAAPEDIRAAHKRLISQLHPDKGGTDYLASKINEARDLLLEKAQSLVDPGP